MKLSDLKDIYSNKVCFILGAGPSLRFVSKELLGNNIIFSCNSSIIKFPNSHYFVCDDTEARNWSWYREDAAKSPAIKLLFRAKLADTADYFGGYETILFDHAPQHSPDYNTKDHSGLVMSNDPLLPLIGARTTIGTAVHLSYIMGCNPIVLLGCDCCYSEGKRYYWQFPGEVQPRHLHGKKVFCHANMGQRSGKGVDAHCCEFLDYWRLIKENNPHVNIMNASGGLLDYFPNIAIDEIKLWS